MAWQPSTVMQTMNGRSDVRVVPKAPAGWQRTEYSFGHYQIPDKTQAPPETTSGPGRTFTSTSTIRDRDIEKYWEDHHRGTAPPEVVPDPGAARANRIHSNKANIKMDGDLRPGEIRRWGQTTQQEFFPKLDAAAVARETRQFSSDNKKQNKAAHVRLENF